MRVAGLKTTLVAVLSAAALLLCPVEKSSDWRIEDYDSITSFNDENERIYLAMIKRLDWAVGKIQEHLESEGFLEAARKS